MLLAALVACFVGRAWALPPGLVSNFTGNGTAADATGTNNGTFTGAYVAGFNGQQAFSFTGSTGAIVQAGSTGMPTGTALRTISFWVDPLVYSGSQDTYFVGYGNNTSGSTGAFGIGQYQNQWVLENDGSHFLAGTFTTNQWYYVAVEVTGANTESFYVNGTQTATGTLTLNTTTNSYFTLGGIYGISTNYYSQSYIQDVHVYNTALTTSQLAIDQASALPEPSWIWLGLGLTTLSLATRKDPSTRERARKRQA